MSRALPAQISMQKGSVGVRTTPWRLNDHEDDEGGTPDVGGAEGDGGEMPDVGGAVDAKDDEVDVSPEFIRTFQGTVKGLLMKMAIATVGYIWVRMPLCRRGCQGLQSVRGVLCLLAFCRPQRSA